MTEETQALVDRLTQDAELWESYMADGGYVGHGVAKRLGVLGRDAATALTTLARDLETEIDKAVELARLVEAMRQERDAALAVAREHEIAKYRAEERANEAVDLLKTRTEMVDAAKTGENWPCNACGFGHSATIDAHYEARCELRAQLAEHERDEARAAVREARAETLQEMRRQWVRLNHEGDLRRLGDAADVFNRALAMFDEQAATAAREGQ